MRGSLPPFMMPILHGRHHGPVLRGNKLKEEETDSEWRSPVSHGPASQSQDIWEVNSLSRSFVAWYLANEAQEQGICLQ